MPPASIDTYAVSNPAFCSLVLRAFAEGYVQADPAGVPLALVLLPVPLVMTKEIADTLGSTNVNTGLLPWVSNNPQVTIGFSQRVTNTAHYSREALLFGLRQRIVDINESGRVVPITDGLAKKPAFPVSTEPGRAMSLARRLGVWAGQVGSPETVFVSLGGNR
jgi:hypothetical protein